MQVDNNLNSMMHLNNQLEKSANELTKLNKSSQDSLTHNQQNNKDTNKESLNTPDLVQEILHQIQIPIAYNANAEVISTRDATTQTLLDIKA